MRTLVIAALGALALAGCSPLTSSHPLFSVADQAGPPPLTEGVWVALNTRCTREAAAATPLPDDCQPIHISRTPDGAWEAAGHKDGEVERLPLILVPAVPRASAEAYAPLYLVELSSKASGANHDAPAQERVYGLVVPIGVLPAREVMFGQIDCEDVLRQGPLAGLSVAHDGQGNVSGCSADNQTTVLEAAQRATIEQLNSLNDSRLVYVGP
jgi:hypothetical protein